MPVIRANRESIDDRFSVLGFTIRTESPLFEVGVSTDPALFDTQNRTRRSRGNFFSSRGFGALRARRGEAIYLVPPEVLANFVGQSRIYFGLATYREASGGIPDFVQSPSAGHMYVDMSNLTPRGLRRLAGRPARDNGYGGASNGRDASLDWGGDAQPQPSASPALASTPAAPVASPTATSTKAATPPTNAPSTPYDDGFGSFPHAPLNAAASKAINGTPGHINGTPAARASALADATLETAPEEGGGIEGPVPDDYDPNAASAASESLAYGLDRPQPDYPGASRFAPADPANYRALADTRDIRQIVIHITDGASQIDGTIGWFQNPNQRNARSQPIHVSAHYVVGRDGEVVQMVRDNDIAWHANAANAHSIGIEHVANTRGLRPTDDEYRGSAALVAWLCAQHGVPMDRAHILGHSEADPHTAHTACPNAVWDWDAYMACIADAAAQSAAPSAKALALTCAPARPAVPGRPASALAARRASSPAHALVIDADDVERAQRYAPEWADLFNWSAPDWIPGYLAGRNMSVQRLADAKGELNLDRYEIRIARMPEGVNEESLLDNVRLHLNDFIDTRNSQFLPYTEGDDDAKWASPSPIGAVFKIDVFGPDNAAVVTSLVEARRWRFTTVHTEWSGDHPVSGHREFGVRNDGDAVVVYTRGADRATDGMFEFAVFGGADHLWRSFQSKVAEWVNSNGGSASVPEPFSERFNPGVVEALFGHATVAQSLSFQAFSLHWDDTPYQPQSSPSSCWAASAAMVVGWRDRVCVSDDEIAAHVPVIDAWRNGLAPSERRVLADAWGLVAEPPASYSIEAFRSMLADNGPVYVGMKWDKQGGGHARVLVGMESGGADDGSDTTMFMYDPWPDTPGRIRLPFNEFVQLYEGRVTSTGGVVDVQILHAGGSQGRIPATAAPFALSLAASQVRAPGERRGVRTSARTSVGDVRRSARAMALQDADGQATAESIDYPVALVPQPDKLSCWAASMAMLLGFRRRQSIAPETLAADVGGSLMSSYGWDLLQAVRERFGFGVCEMPSNTSLYLSPAQWASWLRDHGPLWVVLVGMPHAVVIAGLRGDTSDPARCEVRLLNPWDTRVSFDDDPVEFHPANAGYAQWLPFQQFAADFGDMAEPNYGNWRVLYLAADAVQPAATSSAPATTTASAQGLARPPRPVRAFGLDIAAAPDEPIEPSRVPGVAMRRQRGSQARVTWALDQLDGVKLPDPSAANVPALASVTVALDRWPSIGADAVALPLTLRFEAGGGALGNVRIVAGAPASLPYDVSVTATIADEAPPAAATLALVALKVTIDIDFSGLSDGDASARMTLRLFGNGRYDLDSVWL
jgi:hypothetical protein